uniref:hypothetical protein n=1 Tax=Cronobacter sakazakii TaxID=28141 RepID=UPI00191C84F4
MGTVGDLDARVGALAREIRSDTTSGAQASAFHKALAEVEAAVDRIMRAAAESRHASDGMNQQMAVIEAEPRQATQALQTALQRSESFLRVSEHLMEAIAACGIETEDSPYIAAAQEAAAQISQLLENAVRTGMLTLADLFD